MSAKDAVAILQGAFGARILEAVPEPPPPTKEAAGIRDPYVRIAARDLVEVATFLRDEPRLRFDLLSCLTAVDYPKESRIQLVYALCSVPLKHTLALRVDLPRSAPRAPTLERVYRAADWHEREAYDLMGVLFEGHHNLARILCAEDWEGHPLRKDYAMPASYHGIPNAFGTFFDTQNP